MLPGKKAVSRGIVNGAAADESSSHEQQQQQQQQDDTVETVRQLPLRSGKCDFVSLKCAFQLF